MSEHHTPDPYLIMNLYSIVTQTTTIQIIRGCDSINKTECIFPNELTKIWNIKIGEYLTSIIVFYYYYTQFRDFS